MMFLLNFVSSMICGIVALVMMNDAAYLWAAGLWFFALTNFMLCVKEMIVIDLKE